MSWFDTSGLTSLAKTALKEAQKTIDKALDIQHDGSEQEKAPPEKSLTDPTPTPAKEGGDFFSSWGLTASDSLVSHESAPSVITQSPSKTVSQSLWGSFTGSFFDQEQQKDEAIKEKKPNLEVIADDSSEVGIGDELFSKSEFVVHGLSEDSEGSSNYSRLNGENDAVEIPKSAVENSSSVEDVISSGHKSDLSLLIKNTIGETYPISLRRLSDKQNSSYINRLSIISSESGKNSSESIEVLSSQSLKTTPDSEGSLGLKLPSSSVEVLPDSLMTPSSVELLGFSNSGESHGSDDEFRSPLTSPIDIECSHDTKASNKTVTDEDIKILHETNLGNMDEDETSAAEDTISYNSISEFTAPTILDSFNIPKTKELPSRKHAAQYTELLDSISPDTLVASRSNEDFPITRAPSRNVTQFSSFSNAQLRDKLDKPSNITSGDIITQPSLVSQNSISSLSLATESYSSSNEGSWSDRTINADGENSLEIGNEDTFINTSNTMPRTASSYYVKGLLEEAINDKLNDKASESSFCKVGDASENVNMSWKDGTYSSSSQSYEEVDKASSVDHLEHVTLANIEFGAREQHSPVSSESRSGDMVKIGSEQTSGHTSGDDLETTTSSDIEIIPSPSGDYGSVYSRHSPAKLPMKFSKQSGSVVDFVLGKTIANKIRGHNRELSEASSQSNTSDDSHCSETEKLLKRLSEMAEVLECREAKLIEISRKNIDLAENNSELKDLVENLQGKQDVGDVTLITEEYTQRMSALEKKFQQAIREKDILRKQMETYKQEAATRMTSGELENSIGERDETIRELREEGEKLSKQQLHHSTIIKRLRTKEKENEQVIKTLRDKVAEQAQELDRLKRSIGAKEAVECAQIESIYKLTTSNKKMDADLSDNKALLDDANQKLDTMRTSLEAAKRELLELNKNSGDLAKRQEALVNVEKEKATMESENEQLSHQLEELRIKLRQDEQRWMNREAALRIEVNRQMARAEEAEAQAAGGGEGAGDGGGEGLQGQDGGALLAQLAALQDSCLERDRRAQARERQLQQLAGDSQTKLAKTVEAHQMLKEECQNLRTKISSLEYSLTHATQKLDSSLSACEEHMEQLKIALDTNERLKKEFDNFKKETTHLSSQMHERLRNMEQHLSVEKAACDAEKRRNALLQEQLREASHAVEHGDSSLLLARLMGAGPSGAPEGVGQANYSALDRQEAPSPHGSIGRDSLASESLTSGMWLEDTDTMGSVNMSSCGDSGMVAMEQLQATLQRREGELKAARRATRASHAQRAALARELAAHAAELDTMQSLQHQYDALLQMYGEKEEQMEELRLDLQDVKDMYKMQLDEILMLKRQAAERNN